MVACDRASEEKSRQRGTFTRKLGSIPDWKGESTLQAILVAVLVLGTTACYSMAGDPPDLESGPNPCEDPLLLELRAEPVDSLSERQFEMLKILEERCTKHVDPSQDPRLDEGARPVANGDLSRRSSAMIIGGLGIPLGEFGDDEAEIGIGGTLRVEVPSGSRLSLGPSLGFHRFPIDFDGPPGLEGRWEIGTFGLGLSSLLDEGAYFFWGVGVALPDVVATLDEPFSSDEEKVSIDASPFVEGGLRMGLARGPFIELMYSRIFTDGKKAKNDGDYLPSGLKYDIQWFAVRFGIRLVL